MTDKRKIKATDGVREMQSYLSEYSVFRKIWEGGIKEKYHFGNPTNDEFYEGKAEDSNDLSAEARVKMFEIRRFVTSLPGGDEKLFLFLRYIHGATMKECAERLNMAPRTVFRLQRDALLMAYREKQKRCGETVCVE